MSPTNKIVTALVSFAALCVAIISVSIAPVIYEMQSIGLQIKEQNEKIGALDRRIEKVREFRQFYETNAARFDKYDKIMIDPQRPLDFIGFLEKTANDCQVQAVFSPSSPQKIGSDPWPSINFQIQLTGGLSSVMKYVKKIESAIYLVETHGLNISRSAAAGGESQPATQVKAGLSVKVFTR